LPWEVEIVNIIDSTNNEVYRRLAAGEPPPFGVAAEQQSAGKGRRGRPWVSPFGQNIYYSVVTELQGLQQLEGLSLTAGVAVIDALKAVGVTTAGLKWPNDVIIDDRKVAGVLVELHGDLSEYCRAVIGIGINVNMRETAAVDQPWTSLRNATGNNFNRSEVLLQLTKSLGACLELHACSGFQALKDRWEDMHVWAGREVILSSGAQITRGIALGVDRRGALRMQTSCGEQIFSGGELSLRLCR
jgi:BirA family biotin operon repressor/biotin-[acetyl-CoA-carboxylase] ligase